MPFRSLTLTGEQIRAARALARMEQLELARRSGVSLETIKRLERIRGPVEANSRTLIAIGEAFDLLGIEFDSDDGFGVRMRVGPEQGDARAARSAITAAAVPVHRLIYYSTMSPQLQDAVKATLDDILEESLARNARLGVTGALLACSGRFLQVLEGEKAAVLQVYGQICTDRRHTDLVVLESRTAGARLFQDWSLCCGQFDADDPDFRSEPAMRDGFKPELLSSVAALGLLIVVRDLQLGPLGARRPELRASSVPAECPDRMGANLSSDDRAA